MNRLERTYRVLLTAYPPDYLADREEELAGTLLAAAPVGATRPPWREMVSLVRSGITERSRRFGAPTRRHGLAAASGVAAGVLAASVTYHVGLQLTPTWSAAYPTAFFPYWTVLTLVAMAGHLARGRGRDSARVVLVLVGAVGMVAGPASVLAWRSAIAASVLFGLIATLRPDVSGWWPTSQLRPSAWPSASAASTTNSARSPAGRIRPAARSSPFSRSGSSCDGSCRSCSGRPSCGRGSLPTSASRWA